MSKAKTAFPGFSAPAVGFEAPLEMLAACHGRVESQCETLLRLLPHVAANGPDAAAREASQNVMRYFDTSARHHHADEEEDLFPTLLQAAPAAELAALRELVAALQAQHRELEQAWGKVRRMLDGIRLGTRRELDAAAVESLVGLYRSHIAREEAELLPLAARILGLAQLDRVGGAMRARRGIKEI
ncbi:MAG: hemerythrin domain-containing protein [Burkholderiales bacterium]|nr:hemerythrin domain-containing protein [Burkholderiales bacterium]